MAHLLFLMGLPGSGKSTLAKFLLRGDRTPDRVLISTDGIRADLFGNESVQGDWLQVWQEVEQRFRVAVDQIQQGQRSAAIYDATNAVQQQRRDAIALARQSGFTHLTGIWLNTPLWLCLQRNQQRDRQVPAEVIERMSRCLNDVAPSESEGFQQLIEITLL
jgi:predicted kinase